eukprot:jgi/Botrbrau1/16581/Bobra.0068s0012.1
MPGGPRPARVAGSRGDQEHTDFTVHTSNNGCTTVSRQFLLSSIWVADAKVQFRTGRLPVLLATGVKALYCQYLRKSRRYVVVGEPKEPCKVLKHQIATKTLHVCH